MDTLFNAKINFLGVNQKIGRAKDKIKAALSQFIARLKLAEGSKTENKFVIIFSLIGWLLEILLDLLEGLLALGLKNRF